MSKKIDPKSNLNGDHIEVFYVPLPPEKRAAWDQAMHIIAEMLYAAWLEEQSKEAPVFSPFCSENDP